MSKRMESAIAMVEALRPYVRGPGVGMLAALAALLQPSAGALRQRKIDAKKSVRSDAHSDADSDASPPLLSSEPPILPSETPTNISDSQNQAPSEPPTATSQWFGRGGGGGVRSDAHSDATRWCGLLRVFECVVHNGVPSVPQALARQHLTNLLPALDARCGRKPLEYFEAVLRPYDAAKRAKGEVSDLRFFCQDFARWADRPAKPQTGDDRADRIRKLKQAIADARIDLEIAETDADRERARHRVVEAETALDALAGSS